jgi:hypothetical protein
MVQLVVNGTNLAGRAAAAGYGMLGGKRTEGPKSI